MHNTAAEAETAARRTLSPGYWFMFKTAAALMVTSSAISLNNENWPIEIEGTEANRASKRYPIIHQQCFFP